MAKKEKAATEEDSTLVSAAKAIGKAVGKAAHAVGVEGEAKTVARPKVGKLQKKTKSRLPRKQKKLEKKSQAKKAAQK